MLYNMLLYIGPMLIYDLLPNFDVILEFLIKTRTKRENTDYNICIFIIISAPRQDILFLLELLYILHPCASFITIG